MNRCLARQAFGVCAVLALLGSRSGSFVSADERAAPLKEQVVIMNNMQLIKGSVSRSPNGYVVEHAAGRLVIPTDEVRVVGKDIPDAFQRMTESYPNPTAATHFLLAQWAYSHELKADARAQLVMALDRDEDHEQARAMLTRIDEQFAAERRRAAAAKPKPPLPRIVNGIELPEVESLAGLSRETAALFTTRIQPLMLNKCGNAKCHGPQSESGFRLEQIRGTGPGSRGHTERNLAAVLEQIDQARINHSPLLTVPMQSHGGLNKAIFYGPTGERQMQVLRNWVRSASKELAQDAHVAEQRPSLVNGKPVFPKSPRSQASVEEADDADEPEPSPTTAAPRSKPSRAATDDEDDLDDAFDPEIFNRRYHGTPVDKTKKRRSSP